MLRRFKRQVRLLWPVAVMALLLVTVAIIL